MNLLHVAYSNCIVSSYRYYLLTASLEVLIQRRIMVSLIIYQSAIRLLQTSHICDMMNICHGVLQAFIEEMDAAQSTIQMFSR